MTANLFNGRAKDRGLVELLENERPDFVALQEVHPAQVRRLQPVFESHFSHGTLAPRPHCLGMAILSRCPVDLDRIPLPNRDALVARLVPVEGSTASPLEVINTHLTSLHQWPQWRRALERRAQVDGLTEYLSGEVPARRVMLGDLNSTSAFPAYRALTSFLKDAAIEAASRNGGRVYATWAPRPGMRRLLRIDHALVDRSLHVAAARVFDLPGSDHAALIIDVDLPDR